MATLRGDLWYLASSILSSFVDQRLGESLSLLAVLRGLDFLKVQLPGTHVGTSLYMGRATLSRRSV